MRLVISRWGSSGDVLPYVAVGWALAERGHHVTFAGNPYYEARVREAGLAFEAVGSVADQQALMADADVWDRSRKTPEHVYRDHYYSHVPAYFDAVSRILQEGPATVIGGEAGGAMAAERAGAPFVHIACSPGTSRFTVSRHDPPHPERVLPGWAAWIARSGAGLGLLYALNGIRRGRRAPPPGPLIAPLDHPIGRLRREHQLPDAMTYAPQLALCLWPDWFAPPQRDWPACARTTGFPFYPPPDQPPSRAGDRAGPKVFTTGSVAGSQHRFYETAVAACRLLDRPAILVSPHRDHIPRDLPPGISCLPFAPFNELFGRASMVVHHGGIGTASYALAAGIPQISMPMRGDQFDNGNRLCRLGVARMLSPATTRAEALATAIRSLVGSSAVARRCRHWQERTNGTAGLESAADAIEQLAKRSA
jgi:UDP:flavonoid glycosyltransferase YjiC (YdhE family)